MYYNIWKKILNFKYLKFKLKLKKNHKYNKYNKCNKFNTLKSIFIHNWIL